jgi:hypothetical protein
MHLTSLTPFWREQNTPTTWAYLPGNSKVEMPQTTSTSSKHHHHGEAVCPTGGMGSADSPVPTQGQLVRGADQDCYGRV